MTMLRRIWHLLNRRRFERELVQEMDHHRAAMPDPQRFGDTHRLLEQSRDAWGWNWLDDAVQDLKLGVRGLVRAPAGWGQAIPKLVADPDMPTARQTAAESGLSLYDSFYAAHLHV